MELLYIYIWDDKRNIKGCEFNFSSNYKFSYNPETKTFSMVTYKGLPYRWFGDNIINMSAIVGKNGTGKTNLLDCIVRALCGQGGGYIFYKHNNKIYSNISRTHDCFHFDFEVNQFDRGGWPLNSEFEEHISNCAVAYYSTTIDRSISKNNSHYYKFSDISNSYLLRLPIGDIASTPQYSHLSEVDVMQTIDIFRLLLLLIYSQKEKQLEIGCITLPSSIEVKFIVYSDQVSTHPTYKALSKGLTYSFIDRLKYYILSHVFSIYTIPENWNDKTTFEEVLRFLTNNGSSNSNIFDSFLELYKNGAIKYDEPKQRGIRRGYHDFTFYLSLSGITQKVLNSLYSYYNPLPIAPYASYGTLDNKVANGFISLNLGVSTGERTLFTLLSRILGFIFAKQGEIHRLMDFKILNRHDFDGKTIILILDEPDAQLHPEWQQKFVDILLSFLNQYFPKVNFQIIFTTHSPILLSDIPQSNIILLEKGPNGRCQVIKKQNYKETFAANIHSLYNDSFFLDGIPIGHFAKKKIQYIYDMIDHGHLSPQLLDDIYRVGEPIIRATLLRAYDNKRDAQKVITRIQLLQAELNKLKDKGSSD